MSNTMGSFAYPSAQMEEILSLRNSVAMDYTQQLADPQTWPFHMALQPFGPMLEYTSTMNLYDHSMNMPQQTGLLLHGVHEGYHTGSNHIDLEQQASLDNSISPPPAKKPAKTGGQSTALRSTRSPFIKIQKDVIRKSPLDKRKEAKLRNLVPALGKNTNVKQESAMAKKIESSKVVSKMPSPNLGQDESTLQPVDPMTAFKQARAYIENAEELLRELSNEVKRFKVMLSEAEKVVLENGNICTDSVEE